LPQADSQFAFEKWNENHYGAILIENFTSNNWNMIEWEPFAGGEHFMISVRHNDGLKGIVPIMLLSDDSHPHDFVGFIQRAEILFVVQLFHFIHVT
jgi:hypothetical protein